eukprot:TRINITY_DN3500_c0_g1_i3.p1 TRINITY_DN3500_c0_g1~~TRINITY_DN3500_c0_g1_i3.p1  ORF type:complete len:624 (+),score=113.96 TRINITY_DN3500_c0_g1_i3:1771-3642(+)
MSAKDLTGRLARWVLKLQEFDFEIVHRAGTANSNADAMSRPPIVVASTIADATVADVTEATQFDHLSNEHLRTAQRSDADLMMLIRYLELNELPDDEKRSRELKASEPLYFMENGLLYHVSSPIHKKRRREDVEVHVVVLLSMRAQVFRAYHDCALAGHLGVGRTYELIRRKFHWRNMFADIQGLVLSCVSCQERKRRRGPLPGKLESLQVSEPWEMIAMDLLGPLNVTKSGNRWVMVVTEYLTKWTEAFALPDDTAVSVAQKLVFEIICRYGAPQKVLTDRAQNFRLLLIKEICQICDAKKINTTGYHPQTDGQTERFNQVIAQMLSHFIDEHQDNWDEFLPCLLFAYRRSLHASTGDTPFFLTYGRDAHCPADIGFNTKSVINRSTTAMAWRNQLVATLRTAQMLAVKNTRDSQARNQREYDARHSELVLYDVGDLVALYQPHVPTGRSKKLLRRWEGPYRVTARVADQVYRLQLVSDGTMLKDAVNIQRLKPWISRSDEFERTEEEEVVDESDKSDGDDDDEVIMNNDVVGVDVMADEARAASPVDEVQLEEEQREEFVVERILNSRRNRKTKQKEYLVKWWNYPMSDNTWEPLESFVRGIEMIEEFEATRATTRGRGRN